MNFEPTADQQLFLSSLDTLLERFKSPPIGAHGYHLYSPELQAEMGDSGYLEVASQEGYGLLEAALLVEAVAGCPFGAEIAASALIGPLLGQAASPIALVWALGRPARYLDIAKTVCIIQADGVYVGPNQLGSVAPQKSVVAYPLGVIVETPKDAVRIDDAVAADIRRRAAIGIAAEAAGLMRGAIEQTVLHVKERKQFGRPLSQFQALQHRLAQDAQLAHACKMMALRAADTDDDTHAAAACLFAQEAMPNVIYDCHQFTGALGLTLEFPLHLWTYRMKYLQGEAGGRGEFAQSVADRVWARNAA